MGSVADRRVLHTISGRGVAYKFGRVGDLPWHGSEPLCELD